MRSRPTHRPALLATLGLAVVALAGCGGAGLHVADAPYVAPPPAYVPLTGSAEVDNLSFEFVDGFYVAPAATTLFTGNLLGGPLPPGYAEYVGELHDDVYDAEADLEYGDLVQWFDVWVPAGELTTFEVY